jgi:transcriptional regulator with XRE-family HTH domain
LLGNASLARAELARRAGVPVSTLRNWEHDHGFPRVSALLRLAEALGVPVERITAWVEGPAREEAEPADAQSRPARKQETS